MFKLNVQNPLFKVRLPKLLVPNMKSLTNVMLPRRQNCLDQVGPGFQNWEQECVCGWGGGDE